MRYNNISIMLVTSLRNAIIVTPDDAYEIDPSEESLPEGEWYITNISEEEVGALGLSELDKSKILPAGSLLVNPSYLAKELGVVPTQELEAKEIAVIRAMLQGYQSAFYRIRFRLPKEKGSVRKELVTHIRERTMAEAFQAAACEGINSRKMRSSIHSWVTTGRKPGKGHTVRTIHLDRSVFYYYLLDQEMPASTWRAGDPSASLNLVQRISEQGRKGVIAEGSHNERDGLSFISGCRTDVNRILYIPSELSSLNEEGSEFRLDGWWSGELLRPASPLESCNQLSLGDSMLMEMIYKSWKNDGLVGYWIAATERLILHGISELLSSGVDVLGYGSGKIAIASPNDKEKIKLQDDYLLRFRNDCFIRIPVDHSWDAGQLCRRIPLLSDMQKIASTWVDGLTMIDEAIDSQDLAKLDAIKQSALKELERRIS